DRFPGANQPTCDAGGILPMASFKVSGRVFVSVLIWIKNDGILQVEGGLSSVLKSEGSQPGSEMQLDKTKTYLDFTVQENNTIVPDDQIAAALKNQIGLILEKYVFGN